MKNVFVAEELDRDSVVAFLATARGEGGKSALRQVEHYNLDAIISVGYQVNSKRGTRFYCLLAKNLTMSLIGGVA